MTEVIKEAFDILNQITHGLGISILAIIPVSMGLNIIFKITRMICAGEKIIDIPSRAEQVRSEPIRAEPPKVNLKKDTLDNDLKKYFNYDVKR